MYTLSPEERIGSGASASAYLAKSGTSEPLLSAARIAWTRPSRRLGRTSKPEQRLCQRTGHVEALLVLAGNSSYRVDQYACRCICQYNEIMQKVSYPTSHPASILHTRSRCCCRCCGTSNTAVGTMTLKIIANMRWLASNATSDSRSLRRIKKDAVNATLILHVTASPGNSRGNDTAKLALATIDARPSLGASQGVPDPPCYGSVHTVVVCRRCQSLY